MKPKGPTPRNPFDAFWRYVEVTPTCWLWRGPVNRKRFGYGRFRAGGLYLAHVFSFELHHACDVGGAKVLHRCDVPLCVNPAHLFLGTQADNVRDMIAKGRHVAPPVGVRGKSRKNMSPKPGSLRNASLCGRFRNSIR